MKKILIGLFLTATILQAQNNPNQQWSFAEGLFKRGFYEDAMTEYESLLTGGGTQLEKDALLRIITCSERTGKNPEKYIDLYIAAETNLDSKVWVQLKKASLMIQQKKFDVAEKIYIEITSKKSKYQEHALYEYGRLQLEQGNDSEATKTFTRLSKQGRAEDNDVRIYAHFALASLYRGRNSAVEAEKHLRVLTSLRKDHPLKEQAFTILIKLLAEQERDSELATNFAAFRITYPKNALLNELTLQFAMALVRQKKYDQARGELSNLKNLSAAQENWHSYASGICYYQLGFFKQAINFFKKCRSTQNFPDAALASAYEIYATLKLNELDQAQEKASAFSTNFPQSGLRAEIHYRIAILALQNNKNELAITELKKALASYLPEWQNISSSHEVLAQILHEQKRYNESAQIWQKLASLSNENDKVLHTFTAAENYLLAKENEKAFESLNKVSISPKYAFRKTTLLIEIKLAERKWEQAELLVNEGLKQFMEPEKQGLLFNLKGRAYFIQNDFKKASAALLKATTLLTSPKALAQSLLLLANTQENLGSPKLAAKSYDHLIQKNLIADLSLSQEKLQAICRLLEMQNNLPSALECTKYIDTDSFFYHLQSARILLRMENYEGAKNKLDSIQNFSNTTKDQCSVAAIRGTLLVQQGSIDSARRTLEIANRENQWHEGDYAIYLLAKAKIEFHLKKYNQAWKSANRVHILFNDAQFSPASLFTAIESAVALKRLDDAKKLRNELQNRFPQYLKQPNVANFIAKYLAD